MKCPKCGFHVKAISALRAKNRVIACGNCGRDLRVDGTWWFVAMPLVVFFFVPFFLFSPGSNWLLPVSASAILVTYFVSFLLFVRLQEMESNESKGSDSP
jgi:hypothetical protein